MLSQQTSFLLVYFSFCKTILQSCLPALWWVFHDLSILCIQNKEIFQCIHTVSIFSWQYDRHIVSHPGEDSPWSKQSKKAMAHFLFLFFFPWKSISKQHTESCPVRDCVNAVTVICWDTIKNKSALQWPVWYSERALSGAELIRCLFEYIQKLLNYRRASYSFDAFDFLVQRTSEE